MTKACLGLGTNLGDRAAQLAHALLRLDAVDGIHLGSVSPVYRSAPWGVEDQPDFLNLCVCIETGLTPPALLAACKAVEVQLGRQVRERWGPREIDVDVLLMAGVEMETPDLTLPHPRMFQRRFVLAPLADIAPDWIVRNRSIEAHALELGSDNLCEYDAAETARVQALLSAP
jgi:2-amino-4-hydroxy-6-hydroxymethyldihydropteridine diphosphokinase